MLTSKWSLGRKNNMQHGNTCTFQHTWLRFCFNGFRVCFGVFTFAIFSCLFPTGVVSTFSTLAFFFAIPIFCSRWRDLRLNVFETIGLLLFAWLCLSFAWTESGLLSGLGAVSEYRIYFMIPVFATAILESRNLTPYLVSCSFIGATIALAASFLIFFDVIKVEGKMSLANSIFHGFIISLLYFASLLAVRETQGKARVFFIALASIAAINVLFVEVGRTGYLQIISATLAYVLICYPKFWRLALAGFVILVAVVFLGSIFVLDDYEVLFGTLVEKLRDGQHGYSNSLRLDYYQGALFLGANNFPWGVGVGDAVMVLEKAFLEGRMRYLTDNVHSEFLNMWLVGGLPALVLFSLFIASIIRTGVMAIPKHKLVGELMVGFGFIVIIGAMFNSVIKDFGEKHVILIALASFASFLLRGARKNLREIM